MSTAAAHAERLEGCVLTPRGFVRGALTHAGGRIVAVEGQAIDEAAARAGPAPLLLPGFVDLHVHGGDGRDTMDGGDAVAAIARCHAAHGTTALLATTMTAPLPEVEAALRALAPHVAARPAGGARVLGVHLEGPFISDRRIGAQPDCATDATAPVLDALRALAPLAVVTIAPERAGHAALIARLAAAGVRVQLGHSDATYEDAAAAFAAGACGVTHLFNAMSPLHHRAPGLVGAALAHAEHAELIPDLLHVHPGAMRAALRAIPGTYCVSDATAAAGMPDGEYRLGRQRVHRCGGAVRLADGTLAGSALTMDRALRNLVAIGLPLIEASRRTSTLAAEHLGLADRGRLQAGAWADVVVLEPATLALRAVRVEGEAVAPRAAA